MLSQISFKVDEGDERGRTRGMAVWVGLGPALLVLTMGEEARDCRQSLDAGISCRVDSSLEHPEGMQNCWYLGFSLLRPITDFQLLQIVRC